MVQVGISLGGWLVDRQAEPGRRPLDRAQHQRDQWKDFGERGISSPEYQEATA